jgi:heme/copper-type cytochrome/quinol oxidase subunit 4
MKGWPAVALGLAIAGVGLFLHFHFFWGMSEKHQMLSKWGKLISFAVFVVALTVYVVLSFYDLDSGFTWGSPFAFRK